MQHSNVIEEYARNQLHKIEKFLSASEREPIYLELTFSPSDVHEHHRVELLVKTPNYDLMSEYEHSGTDFYDTVNHVITVMYRRLLEEKERVKKDERKTRGRHEEFKKQR